METKTGFITFRLYDTWYKIVGAPSAPDKIPLLCLHGGPGMPHGYLKPLEALAERGRQVIFYDQVGCGNSERVHNPELWTLPLFVEELGVVRQALGLERVHLLGHSWGGMLALEYALTQPSGLASLIIASSGASSAQWNAEIQRLRAELPPEIQAALQKHELAWTTEDLEYLEAEKFFADQHLCRLEPLPDYMDETFLELRQEVYHTMCGESEIMGVTGNLKDWDIIERLPEIHVPTLITCGRYDEATPALAETMRRGLPNAELVIFEQSAHFAFAEEPKHFRQEIEQFLQRTEY
jgi:proline-specific peptidase